MSGADVEGRLAGHLEAISRTRDILADQTHELERDMHSLGLEDMDAEELEALQSALDEVRLALRGAGEIADRTVYSVSSFGGEVEDAAGRLAEYEEQTEVCDRCQGVFERDEMLPLENGTEVVCETCFEEQGDDEDGCSSEPGDVDHYTELQDFAKDGEFENMSADEIL